MDLEIVLPNESPSMPSSALVSLAKAAERLGYATAWLPDHILPPGSYGSTFGGVNEALVTIGYLSAVTERLRFGTSVLIAPLRNPFVLAKQAATLQRLSKGRLILGLGVGWSEPEFAAVGADFAHRGRVTDDTIELIKHLFDGGAAPHANRSFPYELGVFEPVPARSIPLMIGGNSDAALRRAARFGDRWQAMPTSPSDFEVRSAELAKLAGQRKVDAGLRIGWDGKTPLAEVVRAIEDYRDAGAAQLAVHFGGFEGAEARMTELAEAILGS